MKTPWGAVLTAGMVAVLALTGCASRGSVRQLQGEVAGLREQVAELRKAQDASTRELAKTVGELKALDGQLAKASQGEKAAEQQVARVEARLGETEEALRGLRASLDGLSRELVRQATAPAPPREKRMEARPAEAEQPAARSGPAEQLYSAALASFRAREHGQAVLEFTDFIARNPQHPLAANAQFWIAEAYYLQRDYGQAVAEYEKVAQMNGKSGKIPDALLKIGLCYRALNDPARAREAWQQLVQAYPDSEAARQARTLIGARAVPVRRAR
ncbi:MAG: tetratricopeptide domain-containing protein [Candidatus Rokubacteria bacterium CSP1-6]|nr:MAG: tetratricopeptide domain-containing protein [Candidatus Rokubacteria bacterium CSP1-6]